MAVTAGDKIVGVRQRASGRCLSADRLGCIRDWKEAVAFLKDDPSLLILGCHPFASEFAFTSEAGFGPRMREMAAATISEVFHPNTNELAVPS